jgi:adenylosuccinate synthase
MSAHLVVLSGRIASGKSTLSDELVSLLGAKSLSTSALLRKRAARMGLELTSRSEFQQFGRNQDVSTEGQWIVEEISDALALLQPTEVVVLDSIRQQSQLSALRQHFGRAILHVHLIADEDTLDLRFAQRDRDVDRGTSRSQAIDDPVEARVDEFSATCDLLIDTSVSSVRAIVTLCAARLGLLARLDRQLVDVLVGGEYGSEGKGNLAHYLAPEYDILVRVGGPNAGHKVPTTPPITHRSLPSGSTANSQSKLYIGAGALISPSVLIAEIRDAKVDPSRIFIDPQAMVITSADRRNERKLRRSIRSTAQGVGAATARRVLGRAQNARLAKDNRLLRPFITKPVAELLEDAFLLEQKVFLEGTQGAGLSLFHGNYPFVTSRDTTVAACLSEAGIGPGRLRKSVMVLRSYPIRVNGARSGPMGREISWETVADRAGLDLAEVLDAEHSSVTKRLRRVAEFDWSLLRRSAQLNTPTDIALTFADYVSGANRMAFRFEQLDAKTRQLIEDIEAVASAPVSLVAGRFSDRSVIDRRRWRGPILGNGAD